MNVLWRRKKWYGVKNGIRILPSLSRSLVPFTVISGKKGTLSTFNRWNDVISCWYDGNFVNHEYEMSATAVLLECWLTACKLCLSLDLDIHIIATINLRFFPSRFWPLCAFGNVQKGFSLSYGKFSRDLMPVVLMDVVVVNHVIMWWSTSIYDREKKDHRWPHKGTSKLRICIVSLHDMLLTMQYHYHFIYFVRKRPVCKSVSSQPGIDTIFI